MIALSSLPDPTLGLATTLHSVPFQCSISVLSPQTAAPTAQTTLHWLPFQCKNKLCPPEPPTATPTAHTSLADTAAMAFSQLSCEPTLGLGTTLHWLPSQCSISVRAMLLLV